MPVFEELVRSRAAGKKAALALIVQCVGSSPQKEEAKMLVREDGAIVGTLGGGCLEEDVRQVCLAAIGEGIAVSIVARMIEVRRTHERTDCGAAPRGAALAAHGCRETQAAAPLR